MMTHMDPPGKKTSTKKVKGKKGEKSDPQRFHGAGINFKAKLIGVEDVAQANGDRMCQEAIHRLKGSVKDSGDHKLRLVINVSMNGMKLVEEKTGNLLHTHAVHRISFISRDVADNRAFGYIYGPGDGTHKFFGIKTDKAAEGLVLTLRDLFQVVFEMKKREVEEAKKTRKGQESTTSSQHSGHYDVPKLCKQYAGNGVPDDPAPARSSVGDLLDLEFELTSLEKGIQQMNVFEPTSPGAASGTSSWTGSAPTTPQPDTLPLTFHSNAGAVPYRPTESSITVNLPVSLENDPFVVHSKPMLTPQPASQQWAFTAGAISSVSTSTMTSPPARERAGGQYGSVVQLVSRAPTPGALSTVSYSPVVMCQSSTAPTSVMMSMATAIPGAVVVVPVSSAAVFTSSAAVFTSPSNASVAVPHQLPLQRTPVSWMTFANSPSPPEAAAISAVSSVVGPVFPPPQQPVFAAVAGQQRDPFNEDPFAGDRYAAFCQASPSTNPFADGGDFGKGAPPKPKREYAEKNDSFNELATVGTGRSADDFFSAPPRATLHELANDVQLHGAVKSSESAARGGDVFGQFPGSGGAVSRQICDPFDTSRSFQPTATQANVVLPPGDGGVFESSDSTPEKSLPLPAVPPPPLPRLSDQPAAAPELPPRPSTSCSLTTPATPPIHRQPRPTATLLRQRTLPSLEPFNKAPLASRVFPRQSTLPADEPPPPPPRKKLLQPTLPQHSTTPSPPHSSGRRPSPMSAVSGSDPFAVSLHQSKPPKNSVASSIARPRPRPRSQTPNLAKQNAMSAKPASPVPVPDSDASGFRVDPFSSPSQHSISSSSDVSHRMDDRLSSPLTAGIIDPFLNVDPFSKDPFAEQDPFASDVQSDPFASDFANEVVFSTEAVTEEDVRASCSTPFGCLSSDPFADDPFFTSSAASEPRHITLDSGSDDQSAQKASVSAGDSGHCATTRTNTDVSSNDAGLVNTVSSLPARTPDLLGNFIENQLMSLSKPATAQHIERDDTTATSEDFIDGTVLTSTGEASDSSTRSSGHLPIEGTVQRDHDTSSSSGISSEMSAVDSAQTVVLHQPSSFLHSSTVANGRVVVDDEADSSSC